VLCKTQQAGYEFFAGITVGGVALGGGEGGQGEEGEEEEWFHFSSF